MSNVPSDLKYAKSHEWVRVSGDTATVGITDHAQHELTDIVFVELPAVGRKFKGGEACAVVESVKTASDIYSPVSGEIHRDQPGRRGQSGAGEHRAVRRRLVFQNQIEQSGRTGCATFAGGLPEADWRLDGRFGGHSIAWQVPSNENPFVHQTVLPVVSPGDAAGWTTTASNTRRST